MIRRMAVALLSVLMGTVSLAWAQTAPNQAPARSGATPVPAPAPTLATPAAEPGNGEPSPSPGASRVPLPGTTLTLTPTNAPAQPYATFAKSATRQTGVIDLLRKDDELYLDLRPENFDKTYIVLPSIARGVGGEAFAGRVYDPITITFKRVGKRVLWITPNTRYVAEKGTAAANSLAISVGDTVLLSTPIVAEDPQHQHTVVAPSVFLTDFEGIGSDLGKGAGGTTPSIPGLLVLSVRPSFAIDSSKSYYGATKAFPTNDEIEVNLAFNGPPNALPTVPDGRGIPIQVHYSVVAPPAPDPHFVPRIADDRIGYFITAHKRYGNDAQASPMERFIDRWNLDAGPITFYLSDEIPTEYRDTVRRAILAWNDAFAKIGHPNAIVVKDRPKDPNWDPDDARYTTVRWITSDSADFSAYSPHISDPDTGQIIRAEVVIDGESLRTVKRGYTDRVLPIQRVRRNAYASPQDALTQSLDQGADTATGIDSESEAVGFEEGSAAQAALGTQMMLANPRATPVDRERYAQAWLYSVVLHEAGHTLGLRHNFRGSMAYTYAQLHDPSFTAAHGTTGSIMDYTAANLAAPGERQADYFPTKLGPYDYWAIEYGYRSFPNIRSSADEAIPLQRIASRSTEPGLDYGTDEDATANALDPRVARFDLSNDPLAFAAEQFRLNEDIASKLLVRYPGDRRTYQDIRAALITVLNSQLSASAIAARYVGGMYTSRAHRDEPGAPLPFALIPRAQERRAFELLDRSVLSSHALHFSPELLNAAAPLNYGVHWGSTAPRRSDFPIREVIAELQDDVITTLFSPANMARIADEEVKQRQPGETMSLSDLFTWTNDAIYDDLGRARIDPTHRELQRRFADLEIQIVALPTIYVDQLGLPRETQALARFQLAKLATRLDGARRAATDDGTRAHLDDLRARVRGLLDAHNVRAI